VSNTLKRHFWVLSGPAGSFGPTVLSWIQSD